MTYSKDKILVSSCLLGYNCKYNGLNNYITDITKILDKYEIIPFCPEVEGGLKVPRDPCEYRNYKKMKIISKNKVYYTKNFKKGAKKGLRVIKKNNISLCLLKEKSPSCSKYYVYNGDFSNTLVKGSGIFTRLIQKKFEDKVKIFNENEINMLKK